MSEHIGPAEEERKASGEAGDVIEGLQRQIAQRTGNVPRFPFAMGADGILHELVEEDVRKADKEGEK